MSYSQANGIPYASACPFAKMGSCSSVDLLNTRPKNTICYDFFKIYFIIILHLAFKRAGQVIAHAVRGYISYDTTLRIY